MIGILSKIFVKEPTQYQKAEVRRSYGMLCSIFGICLNILLFGFKYFAGVLTGSVAIVADAFNNLSDAGSSFITMVGFQFADRKPDKNHPFGHGRIEYISGLIVSLAIILMGVELAKTSFEKIMHPLPVDSSIVAIVILIVSILVKGYMAFYNHSIGKKINSTAMNATATDSLSDATATTVVLLSMGILKIFHVNVDGYCGVMVALFILWAGCQAAKDTLGPLLGAKPDAAFVEQIKQIVMAHEDVQGIHDLIVHDYGPGRIMVSLHAEVPGNMDIFYLHDVIDNIEMELSKELSCEAVIHMDPIESDNEVVMHMRNEVEQIVKKIDPMVSIHDFRMVTGNTHTNMIFDVVLPQEFSMNDEQIKEEIQKRVFADYPNYHCVIKVEQTYI